MKCCIPENNQVFVKGEWKTEDPYYQAIAALTERVAALEESVPEEDERIEKLSHLYDVGAVFISFENVDPSVLFGGTWEKIEDEFLLASSSSVAAGTLGGNNNKTIVLTNDQVPKHSHHLNSQVVAFSSISPNCGFGSGANEVASVGYIDQQGGWGQTIGGYTYTALGRGSEQERFPTAEEQVPNPINFDVIPNYIAVNVWRRIA